MQSGTFEALITDISLVGLFLKTDRTITPGKPIRISCRLPGSDKPLIVNGLIQRSGPDGMGVQLTSLTPNQQSLIRSFLKTA